MKKIIPFLKTKEPYYALCCYALGAVMLHYGVLKLMLSQCTVVPFSAWRHPLENIPGGQLTWAFLGYSSWFQFLLGVLEFVPAVLLFFRRTSFLGGILMLPATLGIFLVNRALHLWEFTHTLSAVLLLLNLLIVVFEWGKVKALWAIISGARQHFATFKIWTIVKVVALVAVSVTFGLKRYHFRETNSDFCGDWYHNHPNEWVLAGEKVNDSAVSFIPFKAYFMPTLTYSEYSKQTPNPRGFVQYEVDRTKYIINFKWVRYEYNGGNFHHFQGKYRYAFTGDSVLVLSNIYDPLRVPARGEENVALHTWLFKKRVMGHSIFTD